MQQRPNWIRGLVIFAVDGLRHRHCPGSPTAVLAQQTGVGAEGGWRQRRRGRNPTANSVNEEALFKRGGKIQGVVTIPDCEGFGAGATAGARMAGLS